MDNENPLIYLHYYENITDRHFISYYASHTFNLKRRNLIIVMFINTTLALQVKRKIGKFLISTESTEGPKTARKCIGVAQFCINLCVSLFHSRTGTLAKNKTKQNPKKQPKQTKS